MGYRKGNSWRTQDPAPRIQAYTQQTNCLPCYFYTHLQCMCIEPASVGRRFREDKAVQSSYSKLWIMPYYVILNRHVHDVTLCVGGRLV